MATKIWGPSKEGLDRREDASTSLNNASLLEISSDSEEEEASRSRVQLMRKEAAENETSDEDEDG
eukprot:9807819-Karenia_brevis.AAC.1